MTAATTGWISTFVTDLRAFHGDPAIKATFLARVQAHRLADDIQHGFYWEDGKGCAVGCTVHTEEYPHAAYESQLGIPRIIARLEDRIFEGMENGQSQEWPERFLAAIPVGADLSLVWPRFVMWLLVDEQGGVIRHARTDDKVRASIRTVAALYQRLIDGTNIPSRDEWQDASDGSWRAWRYAAAVADAAAAAAADAVWRRSYADSYSRMADKLEELLRAAPVSEVATA